MVTYAASAVCKGLAAQDGMAADIAHSQLGSLVQRLTNAQYSQLEEKVADDYGLSFLKAEGRDPEAAVSALQKLATLGSGSSIFSSHPESGLRAERIALQIQGEAVPVEETREGLFNTIQGKAIDWFNHLWDYLAEFISRITGQSDMAGGPA